MTHATIRFRSGTDDCDAWHFAAADDSLATDAGRPIAVMAHGLAGTKDSGLEAFALGLSAAGLDVLVFDYRGFGASGGEPRQTVSVDAQLEDYRSAMRTAAALPGVDASRLVLWGESLSGGTVLRAAAGRADVAAVVSMVPLVDGFAAGRHAVRSVPLPAIARASALGIAGSLGALAGRRPPMIPVVGRPGEVAALSLPGYYEDYHAIAGPTWRNELAATIVTELGPGYRPARAIRGLRAPWLVQIADFDRSAPPHSAAKAAFRGRAEVRHYPCDHFDTQPGKPWHEPAVAHQAAFLRRVLTTTGARARANR
ncbi:alpha/beta hydrolase [Cryptosporangium aurantiacum]|uniref:Serine aminopeptidase, S33 n=1 Tax=Cryptosporangium aurantiacum TaxID=134849 RepID=A0A1M7TYI1_9ACTN|nr:alpha/beta hydrolase [Cryptosporangium aurantiacum]SHN75801.1 Serine aminopeptidase, S33 [Cryptosporangium aurantiacum]